MAIEKILVRAGELLLKVLDALSADEVVRLKNENDSLRIENESLKRRWELHGKSDH